MPYIAIKSYPRDEAANKEVVERINQVLQDVWGCAPEHITISLEQIAPEDWEKTVREAEIEPKKDKMMILSGEKRY